MVKGPATNCSVCTLKIGKRANRIVCPGCNYTTCPKCTKKYLSEHKLQCMSCGKHFTHRFIADELGISFLNKQYREQRERALVEEQRVYIADTMHYVAMVDKKDEMEKELVELQGKKTRLTTELHELGGSISKKKTEIEEITETIKTSQGPTTDPSVKKFKCICDEICLGIMCYREGEEYTMTCGACKGTACVLCHEVLTGDVTDHICDPDAFATVEQIKNNSRACPGCGIGIHKIEGCSQMFCTNCNTVFDYNTGVIERGNDIHNPHFVDFINRNPEAARAFREGNIADFLRNGRENGGCDPPSYEKIQKRLGPGDSRRVMEYLRETLHIRSVKRELEEEVHKAADANVYNRDLRLKLIRREISEFKYKCDLYLRERKVDTKVALIDLYSMYVSVMIDLLQRVVKKRAEVSKILGEISELRSYFNKEGNKISKLYGTNKVELLNV